MEPERLLRSDVAKKTIRVSLPASVAFELDKFQEVQRSILDRLGCGACCSPASASRSWAGSTARRQPCCPSCCHSFNSL